MSRRDAEKLIRQRGGRPAERIDAADWIVIGDEVSDLRRAVGDDGRIGTCADSTVDVNDGTLIRESEFWARLGLLEDDLTVARLYTPAMLAGLVGVPIGMIRQWHRLGALRSKREVRRLAYFDFRAVGVARKLAALRAAGCSLSAIGRRLVELNRLLPGDDDPLANPELVVEGRRVYVRRDHGLAEPSGQLLIDFSGPESTIGDVHEAELTAVPFSMADTLHRRGATQTEYSHRRAAEDLRTLAEELEEAGRSDQAIDVYRAILVSGESNPDDHFALAELLYHAGDLPAARERYYVAIELDEDFVEARSNLGCVLAELGDTELAESAFRGALACHPHYADAHYHLARLLDQLGHAREAAEHWRQFIQLAPASPWADEALDRIGCAQAE
jgi:tetratricopeptide (TPR) repeat protein